jgi:uncharacterized membrane protein YheB (UPF0754 family)
VDISEIISFLLGQKHFLPLLVLPIIGAGIGWMTNYIAVKMLFHPRKPLRLLFFSVQGVFPKRQKDLAVKLGSIVSSELFSMAEVTAKLKQEVGSHETQEVLRKHLSQVITSRLPEVIPMVVMFLTPELIKLVQNAFISEFESFIGELIDQLSGKLEKELNVQHVVEQKVANFSSDKLEEILFAIMRKEFRFIELIGGLLGFLIGIAQMIFLITVG